MQVLSQAPQPKIKCYHSNGEMYFEFSPTSNEPNRQNLLSYNFENSLENFGGSFSFNVIEQISAFTIRDGKRILNTEKNFMDMVQPLDVIQIYESGSEQILDFIGVVTKISVGGISSNLQKTVVVSGKSIEWLFSFYNMNNDMKVTTFSNDAANELFKTDLATKDGQEGLSIKDMVISSIETFHSYLAPKVTNTTIKSMIDYWYGTNTADYVDAPTTEFAYPISSNLFTSGHINIIDFLRKLLPSPMYEIYGYIDEKKKPKLAVREVPFDNPKSKYDISAIKLTDFTLTKSCEEVYTAFMPYVEGSSQGAAFYMNLNAAQSNKEEGYTAAVDDPEKVKVYGFQVLSCSFVGYNPPIKDKNGHLLGQVNNSNLQDLATKMKKYFGKLDEMYAGDFTFVNVPNKLYTAYAKIGEWVGFAGGLFYIYVAKHTWNYGDNPMINYQVGRGGKYDTAGNFQQMDKLSAVYGEFIE